MRKVIVLILGLIFPFSWTVYGQTSIGLFVHPTIDYTNADIHHLNYSVGMKSDIKIYHGLFVKAALGYEHNFCDLSGSLHPDDVTPYLVDYTTNSIKTDVHLNYDFLFKKKTVSFYTFCGPTMNTCFDSKEKWADNTLKEKNGLRISNLLITAGIGLGIKIKQKIIINLEPAYATPVWKNNSVPTGFGNRYGLNIGIAYLLPSRSTSHT